MGQPNVWLDQDMVDIFLTVFSTKHLHACCLLFRFESIEDMEEKRAMCFKAELRTISVRFQLMRELGASLAGCGHEDCG